MAKIKKIYIKEFTNTKDIADGWVTEKQYLELYGKTSLKLLKEKGNFGEAIGQNRFMISKTEKRIDQDHGNRMFSINQDIESAERNLKHCKVKGYENCERFSKKAEKLRQDKINARFQHKQLLKRKNKPIPRI